MKTLVNKKETYYPCVVKVLIGKYGEYANMNGINYSIKSMIEKGYQLKEIDSIEMAKIEKNNNILRKKVSKKNFENYMKTLEEIILTTIEGITIDSVSTFKENSRNIGQETQGSDAHEAIVLINGDAYHARKHWSNGNIGIWESPSMDVCENLGKYVGEIHFVNDKIYLRKSE